MAISKEQVMELLGSGLSNEIVASTVGCDPSYITQLLSDPEFHDKVIALRTAALTENNKRDKSINGIEDKLIKKLDEALDNGLIYKPNDIVRSFAVVNAAKRRGVPQHESTVINNRIVNLNIPKVLVQNFTINSQGEVVEIGSQTLVTMPAGELLQKAKDRGVTDEKLKHITSYIPAGNSAER